MNTNTTIVLRSHYYPKPKPRKYRSHRIPIVHKIGSFVTTPDELSSLVKKRRSVVIHGNLLLPAINVSMWQFSIVMELLNTNKIQEYLNHKL